MTNVQAIQFANLIYVASKQREIVILPTDPTNYVWLKLFVEELEMKGRKNVFR